MTVPVAAVPTLSTFGLPPCDPVLIQKLRVMDPALLETIRTTKATQ